MYQIRLVRPGSAPASIYDQSQIDDLPVVSPGCSLEINEAGSLHFTLIPGHPLIDSLEPLASFVQALDDGEEIFYGRVISRSKPTLTGQVSFECEGPIAFLNDSEIAPYGKDADGKNITRTMTAEAFFRDCIAQHNAEVDDSRRQFTIGTISAAKKNESAEYGISSYTQTKNAIESNILGVYGGFIRVRPGANGTHVIDWVENYDTVNPQAIQVGVNLEEQTNEEDGASVFTVLRPVGKDNLTLPEETIDLYSAADIAKYGRIVKTVTFSDAEDETTLRARATAYASNISATLFKSSNIRLVDMHYIDGMSPKIRLGDRFTNISGLSGITMVAASLELNFEAPQNDTLSLKDRKSLDPDGTQDGHGHGAKGAGKDNSSLTKATSSNRATSGQYFKYLREIGDMLEVTANEVYMHGQTLTQNYVDIQRNADNYLDLSNRTGSLESALEPITAKWNDVEYAVTQVNGSAFVQNDSAIAQAAGMFELWEDTNTHKKTIHLKEGAAFAVDRTNGTTMTVGAEVEQLAATVSGQQALVSQMQGSALWAQANQILGVCGSYYIQRETVPDPEHEGETIEKQTLVLTNGGGMKIRQNGAEYGVYMTPAGETDAVLTGGIVIDKINHWTTTKISGDVVDISASQVQLRAGETLDSVVGHFQEEWYDYYEQGTYMGRKKRLVFRADGGMRVERLDDEGTTISVGLWDDHNLTAGVMVNKINNETNVKINGTRVDIRAEQMASIGIYTENHFDAGFIVNRINDGANTQFVINADRIKIGGSGNTRVTLADRVTVDSNGNILVGGNLVNATGFHGDTIGNHYYVETQGSGGNAHQVNVPMIKTVTVTDNVLNFYRFGDSEPYVTFSKATALDGVWSSGHLHVTAKQTNYDTSTQTNKTVTVQNYHQYLFIGEKENQDQTAYTEGNNVWYVPIYASVNSDNSNAEKILRVPVNATSIRTAGKMDVELNSASWTYDGDNVDTNNRNTNTVTVTTKNRPTQLSETATVYLDVDGSWASGTKTIYVRRNNSSGAYIAKGTVSVSVNAPTCPSGAVGSSSTRTSITIGASASNGASNSKSFTLDQSSYHVTSDRTNYCVVLKEGSTVIGRIDIQGVYGAGADSVRHTPSITFSGTNDSATSFYVNASGYNTSGASKQIYLERSGNRVYCTIGNWYGHGGETVLGSCAAGDVGITGLSGPYKDADGIAPCTLYYRRQGTYYYAGNYYWYYKS